MKQKRKKEIIDFINRRWGNSDAHWQNGNCLWFAIILQLRFPELEIYLLPILGHFIAGDGENFFDSSGQLGDLTEPPYLFSDIKEDDEDYYNSLIRDCFN